MRESTRPLYHWLTNARLLDCPFSRLPPVRWRPDGVCAVQHSGDLGHGQRRAGRCAARRERCGLQRRHRPEARARYGWNRALFHAGLAGRRVHPHRRADGVQAASPSGAWSSRSGRRSTSPITLQIGQVSDTITVAGEAPLLRRRTPRSPTIIDNRQVEQLPLNGRQFIQLAQLTDGVDDPARRHARRRARAGRAAAQRLRPARRPQHLSAGRREGDRRVLQQPRHQPVGRCDSGIQDPEDDVSGGVRRESVGADQRRDEVRQQRVPRQRAGVRPPRGVRQPATTSTIPPSRTRRCARTSSASTSAGRSARIGRSSSSATKASASAGRRRRLFSRADRIAPRRRLLRAGAALRSADAHRRRHVHAVCRQPDSCGPRQPGRFGAPRQRAAADERRPRAEPARRGRRR